jgi:hypothetical protein
MAGNKYRVANVKDKVIELRIFRASTQPARIRANVQFAYAVLMWTKRGFRAKGTKCDARLIAWIKEHPAKYPDLIKLLERYPFKAPEAKPKAVTLSAPEDYDPLWSPDRRCAPGTCGICDRQHEIRDNNPNLI